MPELYLSACGRTFRVQSDDPAVIDLLATVFKGLRSADAVGAQPGRSYRIEQAGEGLQLFTDDGAWDVENQDDLLFQIDKAITLALQNERSDLFFLHAGAVAFGNHVAVLAAPPGTGKSTLTLALLQRGLTYLSDELAPIDLRTLAVEPYPHGLCLKSVPPAPLTLPAGAVRREGRIHLPMNPPAASSSVSWVLAACIFLRRDESRFEGLRKMSAASAVARLMANALNPLAHPGDGLEAAVIVGETVPGYELDISDLDAASAAVDTLLRQLDGPVTRR